MTDIADILLPYLARWNLVPDGAEITTNCSRLLPVRQGGEPAMLKLSFEEEERMGWVLLDWWNGDGAARVLARDGSDALLIERATGPRSLSDMARNGGDDEATRILCAATLALHKPRGPVPGGLIPLDTWFAALWRLGPAQGGLLGRAERTARELLASPRDVVPLHGDIHHDNILDFEERGWLAIDPKRLIGERGFDYAILFCDPDLADPSRPVATLPGRFEARLEIVLADAGLERRRQLQWILTWTCLSAAWFIEDGEEPPLELVIAEKAAAALDA